MTYRGYTARVEFDERDHVFVGRVLGVPSIISFHGKTVEQLRPAFEAAVDDYLQDCHEQRFPPSPSGRGPG